ncbi:stAR-related lipid transfer protein 9 isoform X2 [Syngnathoides biaculeatus]|uniref:stAR-related lipid transfer protein 9 isoform X2 n=1 Tax=Syngnathoides biaculeatus TaxID=300417 RepID=UPI002ADE275D|nr:stAR-related lipid transfer protein 9 isoform X2 [Syngnathoides biaculeatus]
MANVKVAVRVRPLNARESADGGRSPVQVEDNFVRIQNVKLDSRADHAADSREKFLEFRFDYCYWSAQPEDPRCASQEEVFQDLGTSVLDGASEGYNVCVFAYGQTGSGKTYTMMGTPDSAGLTPRICQGLFGSQETLPDGQNSSRVEISFLEVYNERVRDLLGGSEQKTRTSLRVREHPEKGPYVQDLSQHVVSDCQQAMNLLEAGVANRITAATHNHDASSRSHAIFTIQYTQAVLENNRPSETVSKINLVDLAGSERADPNYCRDRLTEGSNINKSLVTLGIVISALAQNSQMSSSCQSINSVVSEGDGSTAGSHSSFLSGGPSAGRRLCFIPYRDSVLTWLLKDSLGGNSKTIMIATISPSASSYNETLSTLRYAAHARNIVNKPRVNEDANVRLIRELREEIDRLKSMLLSFEMRNPSPSLSDEREGMLSDMVLQNELKVEQLTKDWSESWQTKRDLLEQYSVDINRDRAGFLISSVRPHLVALDGDVLSTGVVFYHLEEGITRIGPQDEFEEPQIVLPGGANCVIQNDGGVVTLRPLPGCVCLLNGREVTEPCRLAQGMVIALGGLHKFRFNHPAEAAVLRERRRASEDTCVDLCPLTPDRGKEEEELHAVCLSSEESTARRRVEEQQCYVEGLRQEIGSEQRRAEKELEREQACLQQQHREIHQWILQEKSRLLAVEQRVTQDLGVQTDSRLDPLLERLTLDVQKGNCPSLVVRVRKKAVQEELLKHHALCRAERRLRRKKLQFQLERIARKRHLLEAKRELQHLEKALPPGPESPETPESLEQGSQPKFVSRRHSFSADLVSRLYPHHTPIFKHFLKRNKSTELSSNFTSLASISSRKWVSDECLPWENSQCGSSNFHSGLNQSCHERGRSSENITLNSKVEENSKERPRKGYTERKPLLPQKELSFKNRSDRKLPLCITVQPLGKENFVSKTNPPIIPCNEVKRQTLESGVANKSVSSSVRPRALGKLQSGSKNWSPNRFPRSHEASGGMSGSAIKTTISCEDLEQRRSFDSSRRWHSTEALMNKTGQCVHRQQQRKDECEWQVQEERHKDASDSESLFSLDSLSSAYATALLEQLKREEAAQSEPDSEDSEMSKDSLVVEKYFGVKRSCQKVVPTYTLVTDPPCSDRVIATGLDLSSCQEPKVIPAKMHWNQQDHLRSKPEIPLGDGAQHLTEDNIGQTSVLSSPIANVFENLLPPMDACSSLEVPGGSAIQRDSPLSECSCPASVSLSHGSSPSQGFSSTSTTSQGLNDQPTEELVAQNENHLDTRAECLITTDPPSLSQNSRDNVPMDLRSSCCQTDRHMFTYATKQGQAFRTDEVLCNLDVTVEESELSDVGLTNDCSLTSAESVDRNETKDSDQAYFAPQRESAGKFSRKRNKDQKEPLVGNLKIPKRSPSPVGNQGVTWSDNNNTCNSKKEHCDLKISNFGLVSADISDSMLKKLEKLNNPFAGDMSIQHVAIQQVVAESNEAGSQNDNVGRKHCCHSEAICSAIDLRISQVVQEHLKLSLISNSGGENNWTQSDWNKTLVSDCDDQRIKQIKNQTQDNGINRVKGLTHDGETAEKRLRSSGVKTPVTATKPAEEATVRKVSNSCTSRTNDTSQRSETKELNLMMIDCSKEPGSLGCSEALDSAGPRLCQTDITEGNCVEGTSWLGCCHSWNRQSPKEVEHPFTLSSRGTHLTDATRGNKPNVNGPDQQSSQRSHDRSPCMTDRNYTNNKFQDCLCKFEKAQMNPKGPCMTDQFGSERVPGLMTIKNRSAYGTETANVATQCHSPLKKNKSKRFRRRKIHHSSTSSQTSSSDEDQTSSKRSSAQLRFGSDGKADVSKSNAEDSKVDAKVQTIKEATLCRRRVSLPPLTISPGTNDLQNALRSEGSRMHFASSDINPFVHQWLDGDQSRGKNPAFGSAAELSHESPLLNPAEKRITRCCSVDNGLNVQNLPFNSHLSTYAAHKGLSSTLSSIEPSVNTTSSSGFGYSSDPELSQSMTQRTTKEHCSQTKLVLPATPKSKEPCKRSRMAVPKTNVQMNKSLTWTRMESMSVHLAKLIHSTSDLLGDLQGLRTGRISGLSPRSIPNVSVDCSTQTALDVGVQTERPKTERHQRPKYHEVNVTLTLTGAEVVSPDKDSLYLVKTERGNKDEKTSPVFQPQTCPSKSPPVSCQRQVKSAPTKKTSPEILHHRGSVASQNSWRPKGGKEEQLPWVRDPSKSETTFTDRASSPIVTVGVRKQLKPSERDQNEPTEEKSFSESPSRSSGPDCGICPSKSPEEVSEESCSSPKDSEESFQSSSVDRRNSRLNADPHLQPKWKPSQSPHCYNFSTHDYACGEARKTDAHVTKYQNMPSTKPGQQRLQSFSFCGGTCSRSPTASLTPSECSTDILVNAKPITGADPDTFPKDLPLHDKFTDWAGITRRRSGSCGFSDALESCAFNSEARLREIERLRQEREQVMASVGLGANSTPLTVELAEAKLHYGLGETDALLKMMSPRSAEELVAKSATSTLGKQELRDRQRLGVEVLREKTEEQPKTSRRTRSLSPRTRHPGSRPETPDRQLKPDTAGVRVPASGDGECPPDVGQLLRDYGRARQEAMSEIARARERLRERTEREKRRLQRQQPSPESKDDPRHETSISNSTLCTGSSLSLSSGPTSGYNSANALQRQRGHAGSFLEEGEKVSSRVNISAQDGRFEPAMTSSPASPSRRRAASFGSTCSSSVSGRHPGFAGPGTPSLPVARRQAPVVGDLSDAARTSLAVRAPQTKDSDSSFCT